MDQIKEFIKWTNENSGFVSIILFVITFLIAWISGFFKFLTNKPKFKIEIIEQCSFCCVFDLNEKFKNLPVHKSAFVIYLRITNVGKAASSIGKIKLGYYKSDLKKKFFSKRNWLNEAMVKDDFQFPFENSDKVKVYPFLKQRSEIMPSENDTYLLVGKQTNGIIYFEEQEAYGNWMPRQNEDGITTDIQILIEDMFEKKYKKNYKLKFNLPETALKYNKYFGQTYKEYFKEK